MKNKIIKILGVLFLSLYLLTTVSFAQEKITAVTKSEAFEVWESLSPEQRENTIIPRFYNISLKDSMKRSTYNRLLTLENSSSDDFDLSTLYNLFVKDQKLTGSCWAFSTTSMLEAVSYRKNLLVKEYSPYHIEYKAYQMYNRKLNGGGNIFMAMAYLVNGYGPVLEKDFPMESVYDEENNSSINGYLTNIENVDLNKIPQLKVNDTVEFSGIYKEYDASGNITYSDGEGNTYEKSDVAIFREQVKKHIETHGAIKASMYAGDEYGSFYDYYDSVNNIYCFNDNDESNSTNHAVTIVGWDDTKQAYIVQNSWGTSFGKDGFFYVSYDDIWIETSLYGITNLEQLTTENYDNIYLYDELGMNYAIGFGTSDVYYANVFNRVDTTTEKEEYINEVGLYIMSTAGVEIYVNPSDGELSSSKWKLVSSGEVLESGYHVIKLNATEDTLLTGDKFAIIVKATNQEGASIPLEIDYKASGETSYSTIYDTATATAGQSLISKDGSKWYELNGTKVGTTVTLAESNVCVRAFTKYAGDSIIAVTGVELDKSSVTLTEEETETLTATIAPETATNQNVTWESSNTGVATVANGVITAVKAGTATITVKTVDGNFTDTCEVTVQPKVINVTGITVTPNTVEIEEGKTATLTPSVAPADATNKNVTWQSSNINVATVSSGVVTAVRAGTATITVKTVDGNYTATAQITVKAKTINVTGVTVSPNTVEIEEGKTATLTPSVAPADATNKNVTWQSSNTNVATVSSGVVTAVRAGTATITVKTVDGNHTATAQITVKAKTINVTGVTLNTTSKTLKIGETLALTPTITPTDATNKNVTWQSSNTSVATVSSGVVTAVNEGTATITVKTVDGNHSATCVVTVEDNTATVVNVTRVTLNTTSKTLKKGETLTLTPTITPANATNKNVTWQSSNTSVATVSNGVVTAVKEGTTTITVKTVDGNYTASCAVTVEKDVINVMGITIGPAELQIEEGKTGILEAKVIPANATNKNITWSSSNAGVATVSGGVVTGIKAGTATITAKAEEGNYSISAKVTVIAKTIKVTGVTLNTTSETLKKGETLTLTPTITPANATNKNVTWESSNTSVATVLNGVVTAVKEGTTTIKVKTVDGNYKATCKITVEKDIIKVTGVTLNKTKETLNIGKTLSLIPTVTPESATNKNVTWESSNTNVATVSSGVVTAVKEGTATITVKTIDGNFTATCNIIVDEKHEVKVNVESIKVDKEELKLEVSDKATLVITFNPKLPTNTKIKWESSNTKVAIVDENGIVTAVGVGKAEITATSDDGGYVAKTIVTVTKQVDDPDDIYKNPEDTSMANGNLPNTGIKHFVFIILVTVLIVMGYTFKRYRNLKDVK